MVEIWRHDSGLQSNRTVTTTASCLERRRDTGKRPRAGRFIAPEVRCLPNLARVHSTESPAPTRRERSWGEGRSPHTATTAEAQTRRSSSGQDTPGVASPGARADR
jgi:hypothetical protein